jgi:hypothetical protein
MLFIDTTSDDEFLGLCNCVLREQENADWIDKNQWEELIYRTESHRYTR